MHAGAAGRAARSGAVSSTSRDSAESNREEQAAAPTIGSNWRLDHRCGPQQAPAAAELGS
jgi:hypothetical protein